MLPNLIVIGATKCGTSALYHYLRRHPEVFMADRKEIRFFSGPDWERGVGWYESWFEGARTPVAGEASPQYTALTRQRGTVEKMHSVVPGAKLIYLVRDPIERIVSDWTDRVATGAERRDLAAATAPDPEAAWLDSSRYATHLEQYLERFPEDRILVLDRADLLDRRRPTLRRVFGFLGIDETFDSPAFDEVRNRSADKRRMRFEAPFLPRSTRPRAAGRLSWTRRKQIKDVLVRPLSVPIGRPEIPPERRRELEARFAPEAERLRELTGQAFPDWSV